MQNLQNLYQILSKKVTSIIERWPVLLHDTLAIPVAWVVSYWLRYNLGVVPEVFLQQASVLLPLVMTTQFIINISIGTHKGLWRFTSIIDLFRIMKSAFIGTVSISLVIFLATRLTYVPRSIFLFYGIALTVILCASRVGYRILKDQHFNSNSGKRALVIGAGVAGEQVVRELKRVKPQLYNPVAFVDDDMAKVGQEVRGIPVVANTDKIIEFCEKLSIELIIIAIPSANDQQMQRIVNICEDSPVKFRTLPAVSDIVSGRVDINDLREVQIDDLLGREPVSLDWEGVNEAVNNKKILVTGGGGSIGSTLCRLLAEHHPSQLIIYEQSEFSLYLIDQELTQTFPQLNLVTILGDISDAKHLSHIFSAFRPHVVFHAAAYKHVPILQGQLREAAKNNILGTRNVALAAHEFNAEKFILISTDKAVNPGSWMGATKRVAEILCQALDVKSKTSFSIVRFGNVLDSAGSVVPLFRRQIKQGGPVTVTHPDVTRYFMTIREATQLILQASTFKEKGQIYVLDMGTPMKIVYLAEQMIRLSGKEPGVDIKIKFTDLRHGEKIHEELFYAHEHLSATSSQKIFIAASNFPAWEIVNQTINNLHFSIQASDEQAIVNEMYALVPEIQSDICKMPPPLIPSVA